MYKNKLMQCTKREWKEGPILLYRKVYTNTGTEIGSG